MFVNVEHNPNLTSSAPVFPFQTVASWFIFLYIQASIPDLPEALMPNLHNLSLEALTSRFIQRG